jgi:hypothetical protein
VTLVFFVGSRKFNKNGKGEGMKKAVLIIFAVMALNLAAAVNADVTIKRQITFEVMGMSPNEITSTEQIQGEKSRNTTEFTSGGMMAMMGDERSAEVNITRLDKGVLWNINDKAKTYHEISLETFSGMAKKPGGTESPGELPDKYEWIYDVKNENKKTENGFDCKIVIVTATGVGKEDPTDQVALHYEFWASEEFTGRDELHAYNDRYSEATGIDQFSQDQMIEKMAGEHGPVFEKMAENFKDMEGYPLKVIIISRKSGDAGIPGMPEGTEGDPEAAAMMKKMMGGGESQPSEDGMQTVFSIITEVVEIQTGAVEGSMFDIPEGYTKR